MDIFHDDQDFYVFLMAIKKFKDIYNMSIYSICLMTNHYHILIKDPSLYLSDFMRDVQSHYAAYHNKKYNFKGHLFESQFKSHALHDIRGFFRLLRYIIRNPVKAGISRDVYSYKWNTPTVASDRYKIIDFEYVYSLFREWGNLDFHDFLSSDEDDKVMARIELNKYDDLDASETFRKIIYALSNGTTDSYIDLCAEEKNEAVNRAGYIGLTVRQIESLTGLTSSKIQTINSGIKKYI